MYSIAEAAAVRRIRNGARYSACATVRTMARRVDRALQDATAQDVVDGLRWYGRYARLAETLAERFGVRVSTAAAVLAATSPRVTVATNVRIARDILATWQAGGDVYALAGLSERIHAAARILAGDRDPVTLDRDGTLTRARKVRSFYANVLGDRHAVTVDTWAQRVAGARDGEQAVGGAYVAIAEAYRRAARRHDLDPRDAQAIAWIATRGGDQEAEWQTLRDIAQAPARTAEPAGEGFLTAV